MNANDLSRVMSARLQRWMGVAPVRKASLARQYQRACRRNCVVLLDSQALTRPLVGCGLPVHIQANLSRVGDRNK
jgi:hypothetical protein